MTDASGPQPGTSSETVRESSTPALVTTGTKAPPSADPGNAAPGRLSKFGRKWMRASEIAAHGLGYVIFAILWAFAFAPLAIIMKMTGKKFLPRFRGDEPTYYLPKPRIEPTMSFMRRQW